jgi:hypothetical protein
MAYKGDPPFYIDGAAGGLCYTRNLDSIDKNQMVWPSYNINLHRGGREKRGGTSHIYGAALSGGPRIMALYQYNINSLMAHTNDGKLYKDDVNTLKTGLSTLTHASMVMAMGKLYYTDGYAVPQTWDGVAGTTSDIAYPALDWASKPPFQFVRHGRGKDRKSVV